MQGLKRVDVVIYAASFIHLLSITSIIYLYIVYFEWVGWLWARKRGSVGMRIEFEWGKGGEGGGWVWGKERTRSMSVGVFINSFPILFLIHLSIHPSIYSSIFILHILIFSINISIHSSIHPFIHLFFHPSIYSSIHPFIHLFPHPFIYSFIHLFIHSSTASYRCH